MKVIGEGGSHTSLGVPRSFATLACPDCAGATVVEFEWVDGFGDFLEVDVWPKDADSAANINHLPEKVEKYYNNARRAMRAQIPSSTAVELRRTLEAAADAFDGGSGTRKDPLVKRIKALIDAGHVTVAFGEALDLVRKVGNQGAHASDEDVDPATAGKMLMFTTQFLRNLFEVPAEIELLKSPPLPDQSETPAAATTGAEGSA